jgi:MvaI/BcnI restriction endonuclease family
MPNNFKQLETLITCLTELGAKRIYCKALAENDNSKQQIYLGGSFEVLKQLVFGEITSHPALKQPNYKAPVPLFWINSKGQSEQAIGSQLILYPKYPEIRLSGFLKGCTIAPSSLFQPISKSERKFNNAGDGRFLFLAVSESKVFAYAVEAGTQLALETSATLDKQPPAQTGILRELISNKKNRRSLLLEKLITIHAEGWHPSMRLDRSGNTIAYSASNGGGYTLEALLGIIPNGRSAPDFDGWEVKAYSSSRITLMTPEPDGGYYGEKGVTAFLRKFGTARPNDIIYFTGQHKVGIKSKSSKHTLNIDGFNSNTSKIVDLDGGINLTSPKGEISAMWSFKRLIEQWSKKHAAAAYIPYIKLESTPPQYKYNSPILLGEGTEFEMFLTALQKGHIIYDPAPKLTGASSAKPQSKARSQFRINVKNLEVLYRQLEKISLEKDWKN